MNSKAVIIDVREPFEYDSGHVKGALNIPIEDLRGGASALKNLDKNTELILYCRTGGRADASIQILRQMGFTNLINGINAEHMEDNYLGR